MWYYYDWAKKNNYYQRGIMITNHQGIPYFKLSN
jgi:hypothetical protein